MRYCLLSMTANPTARSRAMPKQACVAMLYMTLDLVLRDWVVRQRVGREYIRRSGYRSRCGGFFHSGKLRSRTAWWCVCETLLDGGVLILIYLSALAMQEHPKLFYLMQAVPTYLLNQIASSASVRRHHCPAMIQTIASPLVSDHIAEYSLSQ